MNKRMIELVADARQEWSNGLKCKGAAHHGNIKERFLSVTECLLKIMD